MVRSYWNAMLSCAVLAAVMGCGATEKQASGPAGDKRPAAEGAKPQTDVAADPPADNAGDVADAPTIIRDEAVKQAAAEEPAKDVELQKRTAFFRLDASGPAVMPPVILSKGHEALSKVKVGDVMPAIELPLVAENQKKKLAELFGKSATVVAVWKGDRRMTQELLADLGPDVLEPFGEKGVAVVGIAVNETAASAKAVLEKAGAKFANLLDSDGKAFAQIGSERMPRVIVVDPAGKILWFDIEYSPTTRRELHQALRAVTEKN